MEECMETHECNGKEENVIILTRVIVIKQNFQVGGCGCMLSLGVRG